MPCSKFTSSVTCGRLSSSRYWMNCFGALGSSNSCGSPLMFTNFSINCSFVGFLRNLTNTAAVCPSRTGTLKHWQVITGSAAGTISPFSTVPRILRGSFSDFSSSPPIYGIIFSTFSGHWSFVLPASEIACYVVATTSFGSNSLSAANAGA